MAFVKKTWKNRVSEYFNRYRLENSKTGEITDAYINLNDGIVEEEGDKINAEALNDLEDRLANALPIYLTKTLSAGATSLTFTDDNITNTCLVRVFSSVDGVNPTSRTQSGNTVTLVFEAQSVDVSVKLSIEEG